MASSLCKHFLDACKPHTASRITLPSVISAARGPTSPATLPADLDAAENQHSLQMPGGTGLPAANSAEAEPSCVHSLVVEPVETLLLVRFISAPRGMRAWLYVGVCHPSIINELHRGHENAPKCHVLQAYRNKYGLVIPYPRGSIHHDDPPLPRTGSRYCKIAQDLHSQFQPCATRSRTKSQTRGEDAGGSLAGLCIKINAKINTPPCVRGTPVCQ